MIAIHEVGHLRDVNLSQQYLVLVQLLIFDDVSNLSEITLARCPHLNQALLLDLVAYVLDSIGPLGFAQIRHAKYSGDEFHSDV